MDRQDLKESAKRFPPSPGVYLMKDAKGQIIYVGKAKNLRERVASYFGNPNKMTAKTVLQMQEVSEMEFVTVENEHEALILEFNLIKSHRPRFNIDLKDGSSYPYIKLNITEPFPHFWATRNYIQDGSMYFGPFSSAASVHNTIKLLKEIFQFRSCNKPLHRKAQRRSCLEFQIKNCAGPCVGAITAEDYQKNIRRAIALLNGRLDEILGYLNQEMENASAEMQYEKAAFWRNRIDAVKHISEGQKLNTKSRQDQDVLAVALEHDTAAAQIFTIRQGRLIVQEAFILQGVREESAEEVISQFIKLFYGASPNIPVLITVFQEPAEKELLQLWLKGRAGRGVCIIKPRIGPKAQMAADAYKNAVHALERHKNRSILFGEKRAEQSLLEIKEVLGMETLPRRIECFDVSNTQGTLTVAAMSVFIDGKPQKSAYRRFRIRHQNTPDDCASIKEAVSRRLRHITDSKFAILPQLILIDGGKGQLKAASQALAESQASGITLISIAKQEEEIFTLKQNQSLRLSPEGTALLLLRYIRDEAHRFAIYYHRSLRAGKSTESALDSVPKIGPVRRKALLKHFGSVTAIRQASVEEISNVEGISACLARWIKELL